MVKVLNQYFPGRLFVLFASENVLILFGVWIVVSMHIGIVQLSLLSYPVLLGKALLVTAIFQICLYYNDLYDLKSLGSRLELFLRLLQALGMAALAFAGVTLLIPRTRMGDGILESSLLAIVIIILLWRIAVEWVNGAYGQGPKLLLVGAGASAYRLSCEIQRRPDLHLKVIGAVADNRMSDASALNAPLLGSFAELQDIVERTRPDRVVVAVDERRGTLPISSLLQLRFQGVAIEDASTLMEKLSGRIPVDGIYPSALVFAEGFRHRFALRFCKRALSIIGALSGLIILSPLMIVVAIAIKLDSPGPVLYKQMRVGKGGRHFNILKFRSMRTDAEKLSGPVWAQDRDPRVTRVGSVIRKLRIDELPQFINVLRGEMTFVGPRPERPYFVDQLSKQLPYYNLRHTISPGITGWAQVCASYGSNVEETKQKLEYDLFYLKNMSLSLDLLIVLHTGKIMLFGRGAR